ncbi:hypothetical protein AX774_g4270 [Zancudomyces culisetae]|uniref:Uncharacterized protein n=1 Tax=Zancudomyces culisetae TaxID=1213189 RepID=A0A1R1PMX4_ZANCU|nr:hypothetical protein AX774_g4270 [Zancudomyces culisetae]|eukprot:OMH82252.1 hypothetical protein AX774_g4270 [Zancudomyces culisetae]
MRNKFTSGCRNIEHNSPKIENNTINKVLETDGLERSNIRDDAFNEMDIKDSSVYELNLETDTEAEVEFGVDIYKSRKNSVSNNLTTENIKKEKRAGTENKENRGKEINWSRGTTLVCKGTESEKGYRGAKPVEKGKEGTSKMESSKKEKDDVDFLDIEKKASPKIRRGHTLSPKRNSNCDLSIESIGKDSPMTNLKRRSYSLHSPESSTGNRSTDTKTARVLSGQEKVKTRGKRSDKTYDLSQQVIYHNGENPAWSWRLVHINTHQYMDFSSYSTTENELWYEKISACIEEKTSSQSSGEHGQKTSEEGSPIQVEPRSTKLTAAGYTRSETSPDINDIKLFSFLKTQNNQSSNGFPNQLRSIKSSIAVSGIKREIVEKRFQHTTSTEILSCRAFSKMNNQEAKSSPLLRTSGVEIKHVDSQAAINSSRKGSNSSFLNKKTIVNNQNLGEGNTRQFDDFKTQNSKLTHHDDTEKNLINQKSSFAFSKDKDGGNLVAPLDDDTTQKDINDISKYLPPSERFTRPQTQHGHPGYGRSPHMNIFNSTKELYHNAILSIVEKKNMLESFAQHAKTPTLKSKKDIPIKRCYSKGDYQNDAYQRIDAQFSINDCDAGHIRGIQHVYPGGNTEVDIPEYKLPNSYTVEYKKLSESQKSIKSTLTRPNVSTTKSESVKHSRQATNTNKADIHSAPFKSPKATALKHLRKSSKDEVVVYSTEELETEGGQVTERRKSWAVSSVGNGKLLRRQDSKTETLADAQKEWKEKSSKFLVVLEKLSLSKRKT